MTMTGPHLHYRNEEEEGEESGRPVESEEDAEDVTWHRIQSGQHLQESEGSPRLRALLLLAMRWR
jgi:hypothetical protein